ncbi:MAG: type II secretion system protein N [Herminiimonas sp.]|nr:type II secretion system protein N [Herminiimonas sp.]
MRRGVIWLLAAILTVAITVLLFCPASWMAPLLERQSAGRLTLGDPQGSIWRGSGFIGAAPSGLDPVTPLLPGRFSWRLSPLALIGVVDATLSNPDALSESVQITGSWSQWQISPAAITMPAQRLVALGAPLNTVVPTGTMRLSWSVLQLARQGPRIDLTGSMQLDLTDIASKLSPIKPLGAYQMRMDWQGQQASLQLSSPRGPLLLSGSGKLENGRLRFSGRAQAAPGEEERLANLLNLLGQRRREGDTNFIALEFN